MAKKNLKATAKKAAKKSVKKNSRGVKPGTKRKPYKKDKVVKGPSPEPSVKLNVEDNAELDHFKNENIQPVVEENNNGGEGNGNEGEGTGTDGNENAGAENGAKENENTGEGSGAGENENAGAENGAEENENTGDGNGAGENENAGAGGDNVRVERDYKTSDKLLKDKEKSYEGDEHDGDLLFTLMDFVQAPIALGMIKAMSSKERKEFYKKMEAAEIALKEGQKKNIMKDPRTAEEIDKIFGGMHPLLKALIKGHLFYITNARALAKTEN